MESKKFWYKKMGGDRINMDKNTFFKIVQQYTEDKPLLLIGTGATIPYGIPGMDKLAEHLLSTLGDKYKSDSGWIKFTKGVNSGLDLETALSDINLNDAIINDIIIQTWLLVSNADFDLLTKILRDKELLPLSQLIYKMYTPTPQCINIITTNYDRVIEYACDQVKLPTDVKFCGNYFKSFSNTEIKSRNIVNLIKVHGSLDMFKDTDNLVYSIPLQPTIPSGFIPEIITPGTNKYRALLTSQCADMKHQADNLVEKAKSFLCIGYGFNDNQIQRNIIEGIKNGKPIVVVTKQLSDAAASLIINSSKKYVIIQEDTSDATKSDIFINKERFQIEGTYWTVEGFLEII